MVATKPVTKESTKEAVKPLRGEGRSVSAEPVCSCAHFLVQIAHETAGAARTRSSPRPLFSGGTRSLQNSGARRDENTKARAILRRQRAVERTGRFTYLCGN